MNTRPSAVAVTAARSAAARRRRSIAMAGLLTGLILATAVAAGAAQSGVAQVEGPEAEAVRAREIAFAKTMSDRDFDAFLSFIAPDAVFFNGDTPLRGRDAVGDAWHRFFETEVAPFSWNPDLVQVLESGELALSSGPVSSPAGESSGRFNSIWRKDPDGQWRVVFDKGS